MGLLKKLKKAVRGPSPKKIAKALIGGATSAKAQSRVQVTRPPAAPPRQAAPVAPSRKVSVSMPGKTLGY